MEEREESVCVVLCDRNMNVKIYAIEERRLKWYGNLMRRDSEALHRKEGDINESSVHERRKRGIMP